MKELKQKSNVKIVKVEISNFIDITNSNFNILADVLQRESLDMRNKSIELEWEWSNFNSEYFKKFNVNPETSDFLFNKKGEEYQTSSGYAGSIIKQGKISYSKNISENNAAAQSKWRKYDETLKQYKSGYGSYPSIPNFTSSEILVTSQAIKIVEDKNKKIKCTLSLLGRDGVRIADLLIKRKLENRRIYNLIKIEENKHTKDGNVISKTLKEKIKNQFKERTDEELISDDKIISSGQFETVLKMSNKYDNSSIIKKVLSGEYKVGASKLIKKKSKWMLYLTYKFIPESRGLDPNKILGIDMGVKTPTYMAVSDSREKSWIDGGEIEAFRKKNDAIVRSIKRQATYCGDGRIGHGRKTRMKPVELIDGKVSRFRDTCNHKYSKHVIDFAIKNNCGTIQMEDLTGIANNEKKSTFLGDWTYYDLQQKIEYKAKENGIIVVKVKPNYTSARCNKCGFIHSKINKDKWRPTQEKFVCLNCNHGGKYFVHADYNAAQNISMLGVDKIILEQLKLQEDHNNNLKYVI